MTFRTASMLAAGLALAAAGPAFAAKSCDELKTEIAAKLDAKQVSGYTLDVVQADKVTDARVVGSCEDGAKKIVYAKK